MTTKRNGGNITGLLALTVEQQEDIPSWAPCHLVGDYEVETADGSKPILGLVSVTAHGRTNTGLSSTVGVPIVPGQITVEAIGLMVRRLELDGPVEAGRIVGASASGIVQQPSADTGVAPTNEVQTVTVTGSPTGGNFTLTFDGDETDDIAHNATAAVVKAALEALDSIGTGNVRVTGSAGGPWTVTFVNDLGGQNVAAMTATAALTGGSTPAVGVTTGTAGVADTFSSFGLALMSGEAGDFIDILVR